MHKFHAELLQEIKKHERKGEIYFDNDSYLSSGHKYYSVAVPIKRQIVKDWTKKHKDIRFSDFLALVNSLYAGESYEEKTMASLLLEYLPTQRKEIDPYMLDGWLDLLAGWAEIDSLCQSNFSAGEMLANWEVWKSLIRKFSKDKNISKRRASLVLLTRPVGHAENKELADLAFEVIEKLQRDKDILITKAISWLLRTLVRFHKNDVAAFINMHDATLPKIAIRETRNKLRTGRK